MTTAIDRFLYRASIDTVVDELETARGELVYAFEDLDAILRPEGCRGCLSLACGECYGDSDERAPEIDHKAVLAQVFALKSRQIELFAALETAEAHLSDFAERNRP